MNIFPGTARNRQHPITTLGSQAGRTRESWLGLINIPLQRSGVRVAELFNRFNGFPCVCRAIRNVLRRTLGSQSIEYRLPSEGPLTELATRNPQQAPRRTFRASRATFVICDAFTLIEILIAITLFSMIVAAIYSSWSAILRASKVGLEVAAAVQRSRIAIRTLEDSLSCAQSFAQAQHYYSFVAENGSDASLSFVARLSKSFPRSGKFGDLDVRRVSFSIEPGRDSPRQLVLRQSSLLTELDADEKEHPLVLAKNVKALEMEFWDTRLNEWVDEWNQTNQLPKLVKVTLRLEETQNSAQSWSEVTRIVSLPAVAVQPIWQTGLPVPGQPRNPNLPGVPNPAQPGLQPGQLPIPQPTPFRQP